MNTKLLEQVGLSEDQAKIYTALIEQGSLPARKIALESKVNRSLAYKIIKQLIELGIIIEHEYPGKVSKFSALHPSKLEQLVHKKNESLKLAEQAFHEVVSTLGTQFNLTSGKPTVRFYEGVMGIKILNKEILHASKDIRLIRSPKDNETPELDAIVKNQISLQVAKGIKTSAIVPMDLEHDEFIMKKDSQNLVTRCRIPRDELDIPSQIIIFGEKVGLTSFDDKLITTIIEDKSIAITFTLIFENIWKKYSAHKKSQ